MQDSIFNFAVGNEVIYFKSLKKKKASNMIIFYNILN